MKLGIVGLPNVGKSTLFNAITSTKNAEAANYPFCTIEPNSGIVAVPDKRLDKLAEIWQTNKKTPAIVEFVDIAGLVKGASQGAGLGNKFLGHIRECDAIVHVVRCFDDDNIIHVVEDVSKAEAVDPISDIDAIDYELILSDLEVVQNRAGRMAKAAKSGNNKGAAAEAAWLQQLADHLSAGKPARSFDFDEGDAEQQAVLHEMGLLSAKPVLYACNVGEDDLMEGIENNKYVPHGSAHPHCRGIPEKAPHFAGDHGHSIGGKAYIVEIHIKVVDGLHKPDAADLKQIVHIFTPAGEPLDDRQHQPQVALDHLLSSLLVPLLDPPQQLGHLAVFQHFQR